MNSGDQLGSTSAVIDLASGELVERGTYQAYGGADGHYRPDRWKGAREDYRFSGKEEDVEVGLAYFGKRYYAPALNRWVSPDPLTVHATGADLNIYAYVSGHASSLAHGSLECCCVCQSFWEAALEMTPSVGNHPWMQKWNGKLTRCEGTSTEALARCCAGFHHFSGAKRTQISQRDEVRVIELVHAYDRPPSPALERLAL